MPAYFDTGFSVRTPAWHGLGMVADDYPTDWPQAREWAGLTWDPVATPLFVPDTSRPFLSGETPRMVPLAGHKAITRSDSGDVLGVVSGGYQLVDHGAMGEILEAILGQTGVKFETAGSCKGGAQVWALAYLDEPYLVPGDDSETFPFLALLNSHDGTGACKIVATQVRVVCWNTYRAAELEGERTGRTFTFRHTAGVMDRIEEARDALAGVRDEAKDWHALATELLGYRIDGIALDRFTFEFIPEPVADVISPRVRANIDAAREQFRSTYLTSATTEAHRGTALGLVDTAVEYLDHLRGFRSSDTLLGRTMLRPEPLKAKAVTLAREVAALN